MSSIKSVTLATSVPPSASAYDRPVASDKIDALPKSLRKVASLQGFEGKVGQTLIIPAKDGSAVEVLVGVGVKAEVTLGKLRKAAAAFARVVSRHKVIATSLVSMSGRLDADLVSSALVEGISLSQYSYKEHKGAGKKSKKSGTEKVVLVTKKEVKKASLKVAASICEAVNLARDLGNAPGGSLLPEVFAKKAKSVASEKGLTVTVWDKKRIEKEKLGGVLAVNQGSEYPPRLVKLTYTAPNKSADHVVLVGKGITFDSGGLSLKNAAGMKNMKIDMAGGAAVLAAMSVLAEVKASVSVTGLIPLTDNMTGGAAIRPGDVFTARNGKTVEVLNTDAEGRMILADGLSLATEMKPAAVIDIATLTGSASVALGTTYAALMSTDDGLVQKVESSSEKTGEDVWRLPLPDEYRPQLDSFVADVKNIGAGPYGGTILAGLFLKEFVGDDVPWAHIDLGLSAFSEKPSGFVPKGATGFGVRLLVDTLLHWK